MKNMKFRKPAEEELQKEMTDVSFIKLEVIIKSDTNFVIGLTDDPTYKLSCRMSNLPVTVNGIFFYYSNN